MKNLLIIALLTTGCTSGMYLRYNYTKTLQALPPCSKIHVINNKYITYSMVEQSTNNVYTVDTNFYKAYYTCDGSIFKTVKIDAR